MTVQIVSVQFDFDQAKTYSTLAQVFEKSCRRHMPGVEFMALTIAPPPLKPGVHRGFSTNTAKLNLWSKLVAEADQPLLLSDCDMLCLHDLRDVWDRDFDVAYTVRSECRLPFNSGVVFVKPTPAARQFISKWRDVNEEMLKSPTLHQPFRRKYAGMNQASFGYLLEQRLDAGVKLLPLPCQIWNACNEDWERIDLSKTRLVHFKGKLRALALSAGMVPQHAPLYSLVKEWKRYGVDGSC